MKIENGVAATDLDGVTWQKSRYSGAQGDCVELARLTDGEIAVRNSRDPGGPALVFTPREITAMFAGVRDGEFDHLVD
ncbi:uncharacterized protein DUF397 [Asanoa ferruginea]|uniref:Uncharacterized protein DUF397 n=1 Tax=Asanoa ferruginea TaxID=53367 RepID=A0A3D9ZLM7_9ACTN|nr:DUF397 domain-containing protein [Asanoa ferruginea]REF98175.1 uncharacterized protein DUF397 [Asanoa ferruginea]GIF50857.1 hypothetical protein Afe04nite_53960 [Asanoa ferruginea]